MSNGISSRARATLALLSVSILLAVVLTTLLPQPTYAEGSQLPVKDPIVVSHTGGGLEVTVRTTNGANRDAQTDVFTYYTNEEARTQIEISNNDNQLNGYTVRVYIRFDSTNYRLPYSLGPQSVTTAGKTYSFTFNQASEPNVYYLELPKPGIGDTATVPSLITYPSPGTPGGKAEIWATVMSPEDATAIGNGVTEKGDWQSLDWTTKPDLFPVKKTRASTEVYLLGDGTGEVSYVHGLVYDVDLQRGGNTLEGIGKDYVKSVTYADTLQIGDHFKWDEDILNAIRNGGYTVRYDSLDEDLGINTNNATHNPIVALISVGDKRVASLWHGSNDALWARDENFTLSVDDNDQIVISWTEPNRTIQNNPTQPGNWTEMSNTHTQIYIGNEVLEYTGEPTDSALISTGVTITNKVEATEAYCYSEDKSYESQVDDTVRAREANLHLTKITDHSITRGEALSNPVRLRVTNTGTVPYTELYRISDILPYEFYMTPEDMFDQLSSSEHPDARKVIELTQANLYELPSTKQATDYHGNSEHGLNTENTADGNQYWGAPLDETGLRRKCTLRLSKDGSAYKCDVLPNDTDDEGFTFTDAASLKQGLEAIGYAPTHDTRYEVMWTYDTEKTIHSNEVLIYSFGIHAKDSFQVAQGDLLHHINLEEGVRYNYAYAYKEGPTRIDWDSSHIEIDQDAAIYKGARLVEDGAVVGDEDLPEDTSLGDNSVLEYAVAVTHAGTNAYDVIPLVDSMQGIQIALVRKDLNPHLADKGLGSYTIGDVEYYMLNQEGTFEDVWFGEPDEKYLADHVVITHSNEGFSTISYYYLDDFGGDEIRYIRYRALVSIEEADVPEQRLYRVDNCGYLNDHQGHRILAPVGFGVSPIYFDKRVIDERGATPTDDVHVADFSYFHKGEQTIYRLVLGHNSPTEGQYVEVTGQEIWDQLPETVQGLTWQRGDGTHAGDVQIDIYEDPGNVEWTNPDSWSIVSDTHDQGNTNPNQQYIQWGDDFKVRFWDRAVMYVTLTMPDGDVWNNYAATFMNQRLRNTFHYHKYQSYVQHELTEPIKAYLEKSVYATGHKDAQGRKPDQRFWYANDMYVYYTVSLVNMGDARLYVNEFQDKLPKGFTMLQASQSIRDSHSAYDPPTNSDIGPSGTDSSGSYYSPSNSYALRYIDGEVQNYGDYLPKFAHLDWSTETKADGHQYVTFDISRASGRSNLGNSIKYDEYYGKCYLDPGEMIEFGYWAKVGAYADTADVAENTIVMPVSDYAGAGVKVVEADVRTHDFDNADSNEGTCDHDNDFNPTRNDRVENLGFKGEDTDTWWLKSDVTVHRGLVVPGITKSVFSTIDTKGDENTYPTVARTSDTVRFTVNASNGGNQAMPEYVLQDTIPAPYQFTGPITLTFNNVYWQGGIRPYWQTSLNIVGRTNHLGADRVELEYQTSRAGATNTVTLVKDGEPIRIELYLLNLYQSYARWDERAWAWVSLETEPDGAETIKFQLSGEHIMRDPLESVSMDIRVHNPSGMQVQDKLVNTCFITPINRSFDPDDVPQGNNTTASDVWGRPLASVRNSVSIPFASTYQTTSYKKVEQLDDPSNWGLSYLPDRNWINLPSKSTLFAFTDYVFFATEQPIQDFIIIDNLPEVGDHMTYENNTSRDSRFEVSLYSDPQFEIKVAHADGTETTLDPSQYTIDFTDRTEFTRDDWRLDPQDPDPWYGTPTDSTRSFRIRVLDPDATLITPESTVSIRYVCEITDEALDEIAGLISWNSFGYRYLVNGGQTYLEAAPLKVGIRFPLPPSVKKTFAKSDGNPYEVRDDTKVRFLTYKGSQWDVDLNWAFDYTDQEIADALAAAGLEYGIVEATVPAGQSESPAVEMDPENGFVKWTFADGEFKPQEGADAAWTWEQGAEYTTIELPSSRDENVADVNFYDGNPCETWEFTWRYDIVIECENLIDTWELNLIKSFTRWNGERLEPDADPTNYAVFALYSSSPTEEISADEAASLAQAAGLDETLETQTQVADSTGGPGATRTFYLVDIVRIDTADAEGMRGTAQWTGLTSAEYVLRELDAPDKFIMNGDAFVRRSDAYNGVLWTSLSNTDVWSITVRKAAAEAPYNRMFPAGFVLYGQEGHNTMTQEQFDEQWTEFESTHSYAEGKKPPYSIGYTMPDGSEQTLYAAGIDATTTFDYEWSPGVMREFDAIFNRLTGEYYVMREIFGPEGYALVDDMLIARDQDFEGADYYVNGPYASVDLTVYDKAYWSIGIAKTDEAVADTLLADAVFGIYLEDEAMTSEEIDAAVSEFGLEAAPKTQVEYQGKTYTLARIGKSTADGPLVFEDLTSDYAIAVELKAPAGYFLDDSQIVFSKVADEDDSTIDAEVAGSHEATSIYNDYWDGPRPYTYMVYDYHASTTVGNHITKTCEAGVEASKTLTGRDMADGEFSFELVDPEGTVVETVEAAADGSIAFSPLSFDEYDEGNTFTYTIREVQPEEPLGGVSYDGHEEKVSIEVAYDEEKNLVAIVSYDEDGAVFENAYNAEGEATLQVSKELIGEPLAEGAFTFELVDAEGAVVETASNNADGLVSFSTMSFTEQDAGKSYAYTIREVIADEPGYTFDTHEVKATIRVTDNGDGTVLASVTYDGNTVFTNYRIKSCVLEATKVLTGRKLLDGEFSFELLDADGKVLETVAADGDGIITFSEIVFETYDPSDEYVYTIRELIPEEPAANVSYDKHTETVRVAFVENEAGELVATPLYDEDGAVFTNTYEKPEEKNTPKGGRAPKPKVPELGDTTVPATGLMAGGAALVLAVALRRRCNEGVE